MRATNLFFLFGVFLLGCGGGESSTTSTPTYAIGGSVSGLYTGQQISISNAGIDQIISTNGNFQLGNSLPKGGSFSISVVQRPVGVTCVTNNASGTEVMSNITNVSTLVSQRWEEGLLNRVLADFRPILQFAQQG